MEKLHHACLLKSATVLHETTADILTGRVVSSASLNKYQFCLAGARKTARDTVKGLFANGPQHTHQIAVHCWPPCVAAPPRTGRLCVVLDEVPAGATALGIPARMVGCAAAPSGVRSDGESLRPEA
jgi:hypothetical protein